MGNLRWFVHFTKSKLLDSVDPDRQHRDCDSYSRLAQEFLERCFNHVHSSTVDEYWTMVSKLCS